MQLLFVSSFLLVKNNYIFVQVVFKKVIKNYPKAPEVIKSQNGKMAVYRRLFYVIKHRIK